MEKRKPKILLFDIETAPNKIYAWGRYEVNAIAYERHWHMISFAYKWLGEKKTHVKALCDYPRYTAHPYNDHDLVKDLWKLFDEADIVIAHNGRKFDIKKSNARFIKHNLKPPTPYHILDTREVARKHFRFDSNKLDDLGDYLNLGRKINTGGFELWLGCEKGDMASWAKMKKYNIQDVVLLEKVYLKMLPYVELHPNLALLSETVHACPNCGSTNLHRAGYRTTRVSRYLRYRCNSCGAWSHSTPNNPQVR